MLIKILLSWTRWLISVCLSLSDVQVEGIEELKQQKGYVKLLKKQSKDLKELRKKHLKKVHTQIETLISKAVFMEVLPLKWIQYFFSDVVLSFVCVLLNILLLVYGCVSAGVATE